MTNSLINYDRTYRDVICVNPTHDIVVLNTNEIPAKCPICDNGMVNIIKSVLTKKIITTIGEK